MDRPLVMHILCALLFVTPILTIATPVTGEQSGSIAFSTEGLAMSPSSPVEGGDATFTLSLQNVDNVVAEDVIVEFHKNNYQSGNPAALYSVDIDANEFEDVEFIWNNLDWGSGEQTLVIRVNHDDDPIFISQDFSVQGLANLRFSHFELNPSTGSHEGESIEIEIGVENSGNADAPGSHLELMVAGTQYLLDVPSLQAGTSVWLNETVTAPAAGTYDVQGIVNADSGDNIVELTVADNSETRSLVVDTLPDYRHADGPNVVAAPGLAGPWTLTGTIARDGGTGTTNAPLEVRIQNGIAIDVETLTFTDADPFAEYSITIDSGDLTDTSPGDINLELEIDPSGSVPQSSSFNNLETAIITIHQEPNVVVTGASPNDPTTTPGTQVTFTVTLQNVGMVAATGDLTATFDGQLVETKTGIIIPPSNTANQGQMSVQFNVIAQGITRDIQFEAVWAKSSNSYDRIETDNTATSSVRLNSDLQLRFLLNSEGWNEQDVPPLKTGITYIYSIDVIADVGQGEETFDCVDRSTNTILNTTGPHAFDSENDDGNKHTIRCRVTVLDPGQIELAVTPHGTSVTPHAKAWDVIRSDGDTPDGGDETKSILLFSIAGIIALLAVIGAVILTRRGLADAERETYDLCPACDGDLEGDEDICPHCDFDLRVGRSRFHDCAECNSTIPSMLEHCPYCGAEQDLGSHYTRRERKFKPLPAEVEEEPEAVDEDEDEIVRGYEGFDTHAGSLGFTEEQWEGEWDENLSEAEEYFDTQEEERLAAEAPMETDAEDEEMVVSTGLSEAMDEIPEHDLDAFLGDVESRRHLSDEEVELTASDANYREKLFEMTGEEGVLPGETVNVEAIVDNTVVGNEVRTASSDFTVTDEDQPVATESKENSEGTEPPKRRGVRRRKKQE
ncbi:MAG: CARDB domain-containing protein [Candidatus Thermoplasmatota archaeon]|nr:CARDB domain-containing protein [Candidatus Thermoplasmatota archaeon]